MRRPIVLFDCDGVLSDMAVEMLKIASRLFGHNADPALLREWDVCKALGLLPAEEDMIYREMDAPGWAQQLQVIEGAKEAVKEIEEVADLFILTAPVWSSQTWGYDRCQWLKQHFDIGYKRVIITHAKHLVHGDVFLDDKPSNVGNWQDKWKDGKGLVRHYDYTHGDLMHLTRTHDWKQVVRHVHDIAAKFAAQGLGDY